MVARLKWKLDSVRLQIVLILTQERCMVCAERTIGSENHIIRTQWNSLVTWAVWNLVSVYLGTVLVSLQDRCMVCAKHTILS
jgi:hypothetical protein